MPIYEYKCNTCATIFEEWLKTSESELDQTCPNCHEKAQRIVSQTSFVLKGSGWYVTEYGTNSASSNPVKKNDAVQKTANTTKCGTTANNNEKASVKENSDTAKPTTETKQSNTKAQKSDNKKK